VGIIVANTRTEAEGDFCCRFCRNTELSSIHDLQCHRRGGACAQPSADPGYRRIPFTRKPEPYYLKQAQQRLLE
jgi:hypothetical protein